MKYIKSFNEGKDYKSELLDFCKSNLSFLLDNDYHLSVFKNQMNYNIHISNLNNQFKWYDIKDELIPFLYLLSKNYKLDDRLKNGPIGIYIGDNNYHYYQLDDVLNDNINHEYIGYINIFIQK